MIEEAEGAFRDLLAGFSGSKRVSSIANLERINRERGERDAAAAAAGKSVNI
ncbi:hypothetical protein [Mesorhizobium sp. KR1-2]|uniref:hypothetical protein n=1 Tax=Mesorhizobium sp. KR1-2 TaxID=3156609 RepID=UPI0032B5A905